MWLKIISVLIAFTEKIEIYKSRRSFIFYKNYHFKEDNISITNQEKKCMVTAEQVTLINISNEQLSMNT